MKLSLFEKKDTDEAKKTCGICFDTKTDSDIFNIRFTIFKIRMCKHLFCVDCICKYVEVQINDNAYKILCPSPNCYVKYKPKRMKHILPTQLIVKWKFLTSDLSKPSEPKNYCPYANCSVLLGKENYIGRVFDSSSKCPSCHRQFCAKCKVPWHGGSNCETFQQLKRNDKNDLDNKFLALARQQQWPRCPNCFMYVKRSEGCDGVRCCCGCKFCYKCGKKRSNVFRRHICI